MAQKRKPQITPGVAATSYDVHDDIDLCASLYYDAVYYYVQAKQTEKQGKLRQSDRNRRSSIYCLFSFLDSTLNRVAFSHAKAHKIELGEIEKNILEQKESILDKGGNIVRRDKFYNIEDRLAFIYYFLSGKEIDKSTSLWHSFKKAKEIRNTWTHPKPPFDTWAFKTEELKVSISAVYGILTSLSKDMNIDVPLWLVDYKKLIEDFENGNDV